MINPKDFIQAFRDLYLNSPQCGSWTRASENCDYGDIMTVSKDCYLCFNSGNCRNAYYCEDSRALTDSTDCAFCEGCELCYECVDCDGLNDCNYCQDCANSNGCHFSYDLRRCKDCFGCVGLRNKKHCIFNEQYSKKDYEKYVADLDLEDEKTLALIDKKVEELKKKTPRMYAHQLDTTKCVGDYVYHSKNCYMCFDTRHSEDSAYITQANLDMGTKDCMDCGPIPTGMDRCYDVAYSHYLFNCNHVYWCGNLKESEWCICCFESDHLFGCNYMKNKHKGFYILNEKVSEADYKRLTAEINEEIKARGIYSLYDLAHKDLKDGRVDVSDDVRDRECKICSADFKIVPDEVKFLRARGQLLPVYCPACRAKQRFDMRNKREMHKRICDKCKKTLISTYPADSKYVVYCLDCFWKHFD